MITYNETESISDKYLDPNPPKNELNESSFTRRSSAMIQRTSTITAKIKETIRDEIEIEEK